MEIDALVHRANGRNAKPIHTTSSRSYNQTGSPSQSAFRQWARPGVPLCGYCGKEGHLSKKCFKRKKSGTNAPGIHALSASNHLGASGSYPSDLSFHPDYYGSASGFGSAPGFGSFPGLGSAPGLGSFPGLGSAPGLGSTPDVGVSAATNPVASSPGKSDVPDQDVICSLTYMTKPAVSYRGPRLPCRIGNLQVDALVDTGATISAIDSSLASKLGLQPDGSKRVAFTTADNKDTTSLGTVTTKAVLGELPVELNCHVVKTLAHPVIIGYSDLSSLKATVAVKTGRMFSYFA